LIELLIAKPTRKVISFSRHEASIIYLKRELAQKDPEHKLRFIVGDVRDKDALSRALVGVEYVFHTAALKNLETTEYSPFEAIKTNIYGTQNLIDASVERGVQKVLVISTDKAVDPVSLYGASKLCSEKLTIHGNVYSGKNGCKFSVIRFGNFTGSSGSVIPYFCNLREKNIPLPITDCRMTRYFISPAQACDACLKAMSKMTGGEVFVPKMGKVNIRDLALHISPEIEERGRRAGEKIHEILISDTDLMNTCEIDDFYITFPNQAKANDKHMRPVQLDLNSSSSEMGRWLDPKELLNEYRQIARRSS
jgi:UDP-N-acetylglucosamine 4,6-dehydratase